MLNKYVVNVFFNFVLFILVGFRKIKLVIGWFGLVKFVCDCWIVLEIVFIVLFCLIICLCNFFLRCSSFFFFDFINLLIGILVYLEIILVILVFVIFFCNKVWLLVWVVVSLVFVFFICFCKLISLLYFNLVVWLRL